MLVVNYLAYFIIYMQQEIIATRQSWILEEEPYICIRKRQREESLQSLKQQRSCSFKSQQYCSVGGCLWLPACTGGTVVGGVRTPNLPWRTLEEPPFPMSTGGTRAPPPVAASRFAGPQEGLKIQVGHNLPQSAPLVEIGLTDRLKSGEGGLWTPRLRRP